MHVICFQSEENKAAEFLIFSNFWHLSWYHLQSDTNDRWKNCQVKNTGNCKKKLNYCSHKINPTLSPESLVSLNKQVKC